MPSRSRMIDIAFVVWLAATTILLCLHILRIGTFYVPRQYMMFTFAVYQALLLWLLPEELVDKMRPGRPVRSPEQGTLWLGLAAFMLLICIVTLIRG